MTQISAIEWTNLTWNPVTGCTKIGPGCDHCYAHRFAERWRGIEGHAYQQGFDLKLWPSRLNQPFRWKKPRMIFVNSMSDLFHKQIDRHFIDDVFEKEPDSSSATDQLGGTFHFFRAITRTHRFDRPIRHCLGYRGRGKRTLSKADDESLGNRVERSVRNGRGGFFL